MVSSSRVETNINSSQLIYAQNIFCIELDPKKLFQIAGLMTLNKPQVYYSRIKTIDSNITNLVNFQEPYSFYSANLPIYTNNFQFIYFAKSRFSKNSLYENVIAPVLKDDLWVESWGRPYMDSFCKPEYSYDVLNIRHVDIAGFLWKDTQDHSKWAVSANKDWTCYGDQNMMNSQNTRGGGSLCMLNSQFSKLHRKMVSDKDSCETFLRKYY